MGGGEIGPEVTALADFVNNVKPQGSVSQTAHRMRGGKGPAVSADDLMDQLRSPVKGKALAFDSLSPTALRPEAPEWHPLRDGANTSSQAQKMLAAFRMVQVRQQTAPGWQPFWKVVQAVDDEEGLAPELEAMLRAGGFYGPNSRTAPSETLSSQLEHIAQTGGAQGGNGLGRTPPSVEQIPNADSRWQSRLRADLRRAAPEIYLNFRAEGVSDAREWVAREFDGYKSTDTFTEFWHLATEVDFRLDSEPGEQARLSLLSCDDTLEIQLRRLASKVHEIRTGDRDAAMHMLAISMPGAKRDLAPGWMVNDAQLHSKHSFQQVERVGKVPRGGGGGNSRGRQPQRWGRQASRRQSRRWRQR